MFKNIKLHIKNTYRVRTGDGNILRIKDKRNIDVEVILMEYICIQLVEYYMYLD